MDKTKKARMREIARVSSRKIREFQRNSKKPVDPSEYITKMQNEDNIVEFDGLCTYFYTDAGVVKAVDGVSFDIPRGKTVSVVGESGCGKSVTSLSLMRLLPEPTGQIVSGGIRYNCGGCAIDIARAPAGEMRKLRGNDIAMVFQEPMTSLNPVFTIGNQLDETIGLHKPHLSKAQIKDHTVEMLKTVGIARAEGVYKAYPHELSGGMRQRVMIAMALSCDPGLIIADEPTTALDVTIQAQILDLLRSLKSKVNASILLITHDLGVVAEMADYVVVMYAGRIIEQGTVFEVFREPLHPYTQGLLKAKPQVSQIVDRLYSIPGNVPNPINMPPCCYFRERCEKCVEACAGDYPAMTGVSATHSVACRLYDGEVR